MQEIVANVGGLKFDIEVALEQQLGSQPLPFPGMDKSGSAICNFYLRSVCSKGGACPFRHIKGDRTVVCKHWLRGLCKKGDDCEFLHEYDMSKMPECYFFSKFGQCGNKECPFLHIDPSKKIKDCPWYDRGYCRHGPLCKNKHVRRVMCQNYLCGFCLDGPDCKFVHPRFDIPVMDPIAKAKIASVLCHYCGETGHKLIACPKLPQGVNLTQLGLSQHLGKYGLPGPPSQTPAGSFQGVPGAKPAGAPLEHDPTAKRFPDREPRGPKRPLDEVTCYKCGGKGHYANRCPKGHLAFLCNPGTIPRQAAEQPAS